MYENELKTAIEAVKIAIPLVRRIQEDLSGNEAITKKDRSPVTIADFSAQAVICRILNENRPDIPIVGEEASAVLKKKENREIVEKMIHYIEKNSEASKFINRDNLFDSIDIGRGEPDKFFWTLDPIDGTKGFLRGEQFVIALGLIENGDVKVGVLGCPNLKFGNDTNDKGYIITAIKEEGSFLHNLSSNGISKINVSTKTQTSDMRFVQSYESAHGNLGLQGEIAKKLGITEPSIQMDSQVKYGLVASGDADIYLRIPNPANPDYREKIWDHAAGSIIVEEAGGVVTDINGKKLDFGKGKTLSENSGIIATTPQLSNELKDIILKLL